MIIHKIFYILSLFFIWSEVYHIINKNRIYIKIDKKNVADSTIVDYLFYVSKISYLFWILIGLFSSSSFYFLLILLISSIKFLILLSKSKKFIDIYDTLSSVFCIIILFKILLKCFNMDI